MPSVFRPKHPSSSSPTPCTYSAPPSPPYLTTLNPATSGLQTLQECTLHLSPTTISMAPFACLVSNPCLMTRLQLYAVPGLDSHLSLSPLDCNVCFLQSRDPAFRSHQGPPMAPTDTPPAIALTLAEHHSQPAPLAQVLRFVVQAPPHRGCVSLSPLVRLHHQLWLLPPPPQRVLSMVFDDSHSLSM